MAKPAILYKLLKICLFILPFFLLGSRHPFYVTVTNITHNKEAKSIEISTKFFADDFEAALKNEFKSPVNILMPANKNEVDSLIAKYLRRHLKLSVDNKNLILDYLGYEKDEEGVICYLEARDVYKFTKLTVFNDLIYETHAAQASIIRSSANGIDKNTKMVNPVNQAILFY